MNSASPSTNAAAWCAITTTAPKPSHYSPVSNHRSTSPATTAAANPSLSGPLPRAAPPPLPATATSWANPHYPSPSPHAPARSASNHPEPSHPHSTKTHDNRSARYHRALLLSDHLARDPTRARTIQPAGHSARGAPSPTTTLQAPPQLNHQIVDEGGLDVTCTLGAPALPPGTGEHPSGTPQIPPTDHLVRCPRTPAQSQK